MLSLRPFLIAAACVTVSAPALAQSCSCNTALSRVQGADTLQTLLTGRTVCAALGGDRWQERHVGGGALRDYKKGPTDAIDPTKQVGTWATSGSGGNTIVTYSYTGGSSYAFSVCTNVSNPASTATLSPVAFCGPSNIPSATLTAVSSTDVACPP